MTSPLADLTAFGERRLKAGAPLDIVNAPEGFDAFILATLAKALARGAETRAAALGFVARDEARAKAFAESLTFADRDIEILNFPAWDCQPYDRVSPNVAVAAERMTALARLATTRGSIERPRIVVLTVNALVQRVPPLAMIGAEALSIAPGHVARIEQLTLWLESQGFSRASVVRDVGDYAARGGILDLFAPALPLPVRLDFFGDTLETIRSFDPETQRSIAPLPHLNLTPMSETRLNTETMKRFRAAYVQEIGAPLRGDWLFEAVTEGRRAQGIDHWLPLLYPSMDTLFDVLKAAPLAFDAHVEDVAKARFAQIADLYAARHAAFDEDSAKANYRPLRPERLYLATGEFADRLKKTELVRLSAGPIPGAGGESNVFDAGARVGRTFAPERNAENVNVFDAAVAHVRALRDRGATTIVAGWSEGSRERLRHVFADHGLKVQADVGAFAQAMNLPVGTLAFATLAIEQGFEADGFALLSEQDILGDRLIRQAKRKRRPADLIAEAAALAEGDLVVHIDHGVGRFIGLKTIEAVGAPHDCLEIHYAGGDRLFLPVENLELLSRYGSEHGELDRLGSTGWQTRKARLKKRVREMAGELVRIAAERLRREGARLTPPAGLYDEFCAKFPYDETVDQLTAIDATLDDFAAGRPMDRLICGDVGFGKTEVALRAAFVAAINGRQVAVVTPTTLLARQHAKNFTQRFAGLPVKIGQLSRMVGTAEQRETKKALAEGELDIVVGTHAVLGKTVAFKDLGLVIIDEEQHFGVGHKERLKELRAEVHMLTLSATPIPRTLQLAMSGVRELSIMATPPVDRLAVRSFVSPFDALTVREALLRERYRGGQAFYVCPRIEDLDEAAAFLRTQVPESKFVIAHGQMAPTELETKIGAFYDGQYGILLSTSIVVSGLDAIPAGQHAHRASRRHVRTGAALSIARARRPFEGARLRYLHHAAGQARDAAG